MKPLANITIVDFSRVLAAPMATQILAELGAEVIKIERPGSGDETRRYEPRLPHGESAYFFAFNRGKRSMTIDLKSPSGRKIAFELAREADVVVENFVPGAMDRMGLGYSQISEVNPRVVYVSSTGFGQTGPEAQRKGYDTIFQALSGIMSVTGQPDGPPAKAGVPISDQTSGLWVAIAALTGLVGRGPAGRGCHIDVSMMDVQISLLALATARLFALGEEPGRMGTEHPGRVPSAAYVCADERWVQISASDQQWLPLCSALGLDDLARDEALLANAGRVTQRDRVTRALSAAFAALPRAEVLRRLAANGVPAGAVNSVSEAIAQEQVRAREMVDAFVHPTEGEFPALRTPLRFTGFPDPDVGVPPLLGADTPEVLKRLGYTDAEIELLRTEDVV